MRSTRNDEKRAGDRKEREDGRISTFACIVYRKSHGGRVASILSPISPALCPLKITTVPCHYRNARHAYAMLLIFRQSNKTRANSPTARSMIPAERAEKALIKNATGMHGTPASIAAMYTRTGVAKMVRRNREPARFRHNDPESQVVFFAFKIRLLMNSSWAGSPFLGIGAGIPAVFVITESKLKAKIWRRVSFVQLISRIRTVPR